MASLFDNDNLESTALTTEINERKYGLFSCTKCNRKWKSAHSWSNSSQKCSKCATNVYPHILVSTRM